MKFDRIRALRESKNLTQEQMANAIGIPQRTYAYYESGQRMIPLRILYALAVFHHVNIDYLAGLTYVKKPYPKSTR